MPIVKEAFSGWVNDIILIKVVQNIVDGFPVSVKTSLKFGGSVQPLSPEDIVFARNEGERSWQWLQIHVFSGDTTNLKTNDRIEYRGKKFKVMGLLDYRLNGYVEYHILEDYTNGA